MKRTLRYLYSLKGAKAGDRVDELKGAVGLGTSATASAEFVEHELATAASDFLVASGAGVFIKKTLAETKAILFSGATETAINITTATYRGLSIGTKGKASDGSLPITATLPFDTEPANNYLLGVFAKIAATAASATDDLGSAWLRTRVNAAMATNAGYSLYGVKSQLRIYGGTTTTINNWAAAGLLGVLEVSGTTTNFASGCVAAAVYANVALTTTTVIASGAVVAGIVINNSSAAITNTGAAYYGLYIQDYVGTSVDFTTAIHVKAGCATNIFRAGLPSTTIGNGFRIGTAYDATGAPFGIYFDDGGVALKSWGEGFTVGLLAKTNIVATSMTGMPYTGFFYTDVQSTTVDGAASAGWSTLMTSFCIQGAFSGFEVGVSSLHASVDVNGSIAAECNLACISFGGNWPGTVTSGASLTPLFVRATNQSWTAFLKITGDKGCYQDSAAGTGGYKYLKVYIDSTLYTIIMARA